MTLLLIDGPAILHASYHANANMVRSDGLPVGGLYGYCYAMWGMRKMARKFDCALAAVAFDPPSRTCFRNELWPAYKAHRAVREPDLAYQLGEARKATAAFGLLPIEIDNYEADDVIATYASDAAFNDVQVYIRSNDKDLMQLVDTNIKVIRYYKGETEVMGSDAVIAKYGVPPHQMGDLLALVGDPVDNVPGVDRCGMKSAAQLLCQYGSIDGIYANLSAVRGPTLKAGLTKAKDAVRVSRELVRLATDVPLPIPYTELLYEGPDQKTAIDYASGMEFKQLAKEIADE